MIDIVLGPEVQKLKDEVAAIEKAKELPFEERHRLETEALLANYNRLVKCYEEKAKVRYATQREIEALCNKSEEQSVEQKQAAKAVDAAREALVKEFLKPSPP